MDYYHKSQRRPQNETRKSQNEASIAWLQTVQPNWFIGQRSNNSNGLIQTIFPKKNLNKMVSTSDVFQIQLSHFRFSEIEKYSS